MRKIHEILYVHFVTFWFLCIQKLAGGSRTAWNGSELFPIDSNTYSKINYMQNFNFLAWLKKILIFLIFQFFNNFKNSTKIERDILVGVIIMANVHFNLVVSVHQLEYLLRKQILRLKKRLKSRTTRKLGFVGKKRF